MQRSEAIDIAKGLGIVAVVVGHIAASEGLRAAVFAWHMPLFFFLSGMLFKPGRPVGALAKARALSLLVPYVAFLVVLALPHVMNAFKRGGALAAAEFAGGLAFGGRDLTGWFSVFWFVTCLYATQVAAAVLAARFGRAGLMVCGVVSLAAAYGLAHWLPDLRTPGNIAVCLFALPLFLAGHLAAGRLHTIPLALVAMVAVLGLLAVASEKIPSLDMKAQQYGVPVLGFLIALACTLGTIRLAQALTSTTAGRAWAYLGSASLVVMFTHQTVQLVMLEKLHVDSQLARISACLIAGVLAYEALRRLALTRAVFLGIWPVTSAYR